MLPWLVFNLFLCFVSLKVDKKSHCHFTQRAERKTFGLSKVPASPFIMVCKLHGSPTVATTKTFLPGPEHQADCILHSARYECAAIFWAAKGQCSWQPQMTRVKRAKSSKSTLPSLSLLLGRCSTHTANSPASQRANHKLQIQPPP